MNNVSLMEDWEELKKSVNQLGGMFEFKNIYFFSTEVWSIGGL